MLLLSYYHSIFSRQTNKTLTLFNFLETGKGEPGKTTPEVPEWIT